MKTKNKSLNRQTNFLIWFAIGIILLVAFLSSCEKEYNVDISTAENSLPRLIVYESSPTLACPYGELNIEEWYGDSLIADISSCKKQDFILPPTLPNSLWFLIEGECDTIINYFENDGIPNFSSGDSIAFKIPLCMQTIILPGDTVIVHDTTTIVNTDTLTIIIVDYDTITIHHDHFYYDFNTGSTPDYEPAFENFNASESDGTNRYYFSWNGDTNLAWTKYPVYGMSSNTDSISVKWGSCLPYYIELIEEDYLSSEKILYSELLGGITGFDAHNDGTYNLLNCRFPQGDYSGKRLFVKAYRIPGVTYGFSRNQQFNITKIYLGWSWAE